ncbi:Potassium voltage-dependent transporter [Pleurostoma richardsiae]|uniref:Potassium voltage-dependent transporter n=1 Tax=Pleurostoma richardsiae TaxID=41990 RepID=A0AA38R360_9PEZI|nr:Potassium voltage-dependent transporter [Pleurostoma richardsiae]
MEQTFMTIHNLTAEANILFVSDSVTDILGYQPDEVQGKSCFDYFHPDEVPFARSVHSRGVLLDKAAVLHYCRILSQDGRWVSCECCFTVVHDVLVASTSIYRRGEKSQRRAIEAPQIRRIFSCSPRDPRYHMLEHLSPRFKMPPMEREPRAALILNRFTRNLTVMFATNAVSSILGLTPAQIKHKSFYRCIQENCLADALKCLEGAKANDSIAYLRFWSRDPRDEIELDEDERETEEQEQEEASSGEEMTNDSDALDGSGPTIGNPMEIDTGTLTASDVKVEGCFVNGGDAAKSQFMSKIRLQINRATETAIHRAGSSRIVHIGRPSRGFEEGPTTNSAASPAIASV